MSPSLPLPRLPSWPRWMELRIDVQPRPEELEAELDALHRRLHTPGDPLFGLPAVGAPPPGFCFRYRQADGEHYVYVVDLARQRLAGCTVFNRLVEVGRRADPYLRAPHSRYGRDYRRRGLATAVYEWALGRGLCLMSGARQSEGAHALWHSLARRHERGFVQVRAKALRYLGTQVAPAVLDDLDTRMVLLGAGWTLQRLAAATHMRGVP